MLYPSLSWFEPTPGADQLSQEPLEQSERLPIFQELTKNYGSVQPGNANPIVFYTVPQTIYLSNSEPQYQVATQSAGGAQDGEIMSSAPVMLYGNLGGNSTQWNLGLIEFQIPTADPNNITYFTIAQRETYEVEFYGTR